MIGMSEVVTPFPIDDRRPARAGQWKCKSCMYLFVPFLSVKWHAVCNRKKNQIRKNNSARKTE